MFVPLQACVLELTPPDRAPIRALIWSTPEVWGIGLALTIAIWTIAMISVKANILVQPHDVCGSDGCVWKVGGHASVCLYHILNALIQIPTSGPFACGVFAHPAGLPGVSVVVGIWKIWLRAKARLLLEALQAILCKVTFLPIYSLDCFTGFLVEVGSPFEAFPSIRIIVGILVSVP